MIEKVGEKWIVKSEKGKELSSHDSEGEARQRLRQIEFFKDKKPSKKTKGN